MKAAPFSSEMHQNFKEQKTQNENDKLPQQNANGAFWTVCPNCYYLYEYEGVYKECCLRCQNCRRAFQAVAVAPPPKGVVVEGKEQYYCGIGYFGLKYNLECFLGDKKGESGLNGCDDSFSDEIKGENEGSKAGSENLVVISYESDDDDVGKKEHGEAEPRKNDGLGLEREVVKKGEVHGNMGAVQEAKSVMQVNETTAVKNSGQMRRMKVKSVARNTKKLMGRGKKNVNLESGGRLGVEGVEAICQATGNRNQMVEGSSDSDLEFMFFEGDDDVYVSLKGVI